MSGPSSQSLTPAPKCPSCGGDYYHHAGCAIGGHGDVIIPKHRKARLTSDDLEDYAAGGSAPATPSSPETRDDELERLRSSMASAGYDVKKMSGTPAELSEALDRWKRAVRYSLKDGRPDCDCSLCVEDRAARSALVSLYNRQREEGRQEGMKNYWGTFGPALDDRDAKIASLSSQLERLTADFAQAEESRATNSALYERAMSDVERLKAEQLTTEEAKAIWNDLKFAGFSMDGNPRYAALRLRSLSDQEGK